MMALPGADRVHVPVAEQAAALELGVQGAQERGAALGVGPYGHQDLLAVGDGDGDSVGVGHPCSLLRGRIRALS